MKIHGNPGPNRITITFEEGDFTGKSLTVDAEQLVGGVALYANSINGWDGQAGEMIDDLTKYEIIRQIKEELRKFPLSEVVE